MIWGKHIVVNSNSPGLKLLHVRGWLQKADLIHTFTSLPMLEGFVIRASETSKLNMAFGALDPMDLNSISGLKESSADCDAAILCPILESVQIEVLTPENTRAHKDVVTPHAAGVSLKQSLNSISSPKRCSS